MKPRQMCTVPNGDFIVLLFWVLGGLVSLLCLIGSLATKEKGYMLCTLFFIFPLLYFYSDKYWNHIYVSDKEVQHKTTVYKWEDVYMTLTYLPPNFGRSFYSCAVFFDDHYLSEQEIRSRRVRKKGQYLILDKGRTEFLLQFYDKPVMLFGQAPSRPLEKIEEIVRFHNGKF
jgi:hypothetical protein